MNVNVIQVVVRLLQVKKDAEAVEVWASALAAEPVCDIHTSMAEAVSAIDAALGRGVLRTSKMDGFPVLLIRDARYQDAVHRNAMWKGLWGKGCRKPASVSPDSMAVVRAAAAWRSSLGSRGVIMPSQTLGGHAYLREDGNIAIELIDGSGPSNRPLVSTDEWPEDLAELAKRARASGDSLLVLSSVL